MTKNLLSMALVVGAAALVACGDKDSDSGGSDGGGSDLCSRYVAAIAECYAEAGVDVSTLGISDTYCDAYVGVTEYNAYFECYISAIEAADCSTTEGINSLSTEAATCAPG
jgi:hypothetical protein